MSARDPYRFINELDAASIERLIARLEARAKDAVFTRLFDRYAARLNLPASTRMLEVGCGTGAIARALARRQDFSGGVVGIDQSPALIEAGRRFAQAEGVSDRVAFELGDAHRLGFEDGQFDVVIGHTLLSHVREPVTVLREMARVVRPEGTLAIFDGDYASLTYAYPHHEFGRRMDAALAAATFNNPFVVRDLPRLLPGVGLTLREVLADVVSEIGNGSYFRSFAETYVPYVIKGELVAAAEAETWLAAQQQAMADGVFFASCNYYTLLVGRV